MKAERTSWNDSESKRAIETFVARVTTHDRQGRSIVSDSAQERVASGNAGGMAIGACYSWYFALINIRSLLLQLFVVCRGS